MKRTVLITELCSEGSGNALCDYDLLPENVRLLVDKSLASNVEVACDIYNDGLQYLMKYSDNNSLCIFIEKNTENIFLGEAILYHKYD